MAESKKEGDATPKVKVETTKLTDDQLYVQIGKVALKPRYKSKMEEHIKALKNPNGNFKSREIKLPNSGMTVNYTEIKQYQAYCIKKYSLSFMFELNDEQRDFLAKKQLNYFAAKKLEDVMG